MTRKILTIQDISCYGSCSITVALPILASYGVETVILPSAILSTHTGGFNDIIIHDLTDEMNNIIDHWIKENIKFDCIYTGYISNSKQFDYILKCREKLLNPGGLLFVDPAMADNGVLYKGLDDSIITGMRKIVTYADYVIPNITEAALLSKVQYKDKYDNNYIEDLLKKLHSLGAKNVIITGVHNDNKLGASIYDGNNIKTILSEKQPRSYHGTGDIFSSVVLGNILNNNSLEESIKDANDFVVASIKATINDESHSYGVKFENVLKNKWKQN